MILSYQRYYPVIHPEAFVAPGADVIGRVRLGRQASVWFGCVLRGDVNRIEVGAYSNIQDGSIVHVDDDAPCRIADWVHIGHHANVHACRIDTGAMIGIGAIVLSRAHIGAGAIVGAGSIVLEGTKVPPRTLVVGAPARPVRKVTAKDVAYVRKWAKKYVELAMHYRTGR